MLGIPNTFSLQGLNQFVQGFTTPTAVTVEEIDSLTQDIKNLKSLKTQISSEKKSAQGPYEIERSKYSKLFDKAKEDKKVAGEPYVQLEKWAKDTESQLRGMIDIALAEEERKKRQAEEAAERARLEKERLAAEAEEAKRKARETGDELAQQEAVRLSQEAQDAEFNAQSAETAIPVDTAQPTNISKAKILDFIVTDVNQVPDEYVEYIPDQELIYTRIQEQFPFIQEMNVKVDPDQVPDEYMHDVVMQDRVMADLRDGKEIPGIQIHYKERTVVR